MTGEYVKNVAKHFDEHRSVCSVRGNVEEKNRTGAPRQRRYAPYVEQNIRATREKSIVARSVSVLASW